MFYFWVGVEEIRCFGRVVGLESKRFKKEKKDGLWEMVVKWGYLNLYLVVKVGNVWVIK